MSSETRDTPHDAGAGSQRATGGALDNHSHRSARVAVWSVAAAVFAIVTAELYPVAVLDELGSDLGVPTGRVGLAVTVPGLVAAVSAPLVALAGRGRDRRQLFLGLLALVSASSIAVALAPNLEVLLASRVLVGIGVGGFWALAAGIAPLLVAPDRVAAASAVIFGGVGAASVLGVPLSALVGDLAGWRTASLVVAGLAAAAATGMLVAVPKLRDDTGGRSGEPGAVRLAAARTRIVLATTALVITGHFAAFTFAAPLLGDHLDLEDVLIPALLLGYGVLGLAGTAVAGRWAGGQPRLFLRGVIAVLAAALGVLLLDPGVWIGGAATLVWGLAYGAVGLTLQLWLLSIAGRTRDLATSLFVAVFNLSIAAGAFIGGAAIDLDDSVAAALVVGITLTAGGVLLCSVRLGGTALQHSIERNNQ